MVIPPILVELGMKYGNKVLAGLLATSLLGGWYLFWEHKQEKEGRMEERVKWKERDAETERQSEQLMLLKIHEVNLKKQFDQEKFTGAIEKYADYINHLDDTNNRLRVKSAAAGSNRNPVPSTTNDTEGTCGSGEATLSIEQLKSIKAAELLIEDFLIPNSIVK